MSYTKAQAIDQIYLRIHGGQPSPDVNVRRIDIAFYLAAAINYVLTSEIRARRAEGSATGVDAEFLATYYLNVIYDDQRDLKYSELPVKLVSIPGGHALNLVAPMQGEEPFVKIKDQYDDITVRRILPNNTRFWYERVGTSERIYYTNISPAVTDVMVRLIASMDSIANNERLPIPDGMEVPVFDLVVNWFTGQRQLPADMLNNNRDDK